MDRYSRTVAFLKVLLPLVALGILATLFLLSRTDDPGSRIPFAEPDMAARLQDQQVTRPFFSGVTANGEEIIVTADAARPGGPDEPGSADNLSARLKMVDGREITLKSETGTVDPVKDRATFIGNVRIRTTTGLIVLTEILNTALNGIEADAPGEVRGSGPIGNFTAGTMQITAKSGNGDVHMLFKNGVELIYDPKQTER